MYDDLINFALSMSLSVGSIILAIIIFFMNIYFVSKLKVENKKSISIRMMIPVSITVLASFLSDFLVLEENFVYLKFLLFLLLMSCLYVVYTIRKHSL